MSVCYASEIHENEIANRMKCVIILDEYYISTNNY